MIKRKPGGRHKADHFSDGITPEKRKPGRPRKNAVEARSAAPDFHRYCIRFPDGGFQRVDADSMEQGEFGFLIFRRHGRMVGAFREWDYATEDSELGASPPKVTLSEANAGAQFYQDQQQTACGGTGWGPQSFNLAHGLAGQSPHVETSPNGVELTEADRPE